MKFKKSIVRENNGLIRPLAWGDMRTQVIPTVHVREVDKARQDQTIC